VGTEEDIDWDELGERIEKKIKSRLKEWLAEDTE
jgi:5S rRNA maturation endonuclease (ribonuclease M5)